MVANLFRKHPPGGQASTGSQDAPSLDTNLRDALTDSRQRYKDLVEISSDFAWEVGFEGTFVFVSSAGALGWNADDLLGRPPEAFIHGNSGPEQETVGNPFVARHPIQDGEVWFKQADGTDACLAISVRPIIGVAGEWLGARGICRNVTEDRERDAALARAHEREWLLGYIIRTIRDEVDPLGMMNAAARAISRAVTAEYAEVHRVDHGQLSEAARFGNAPGDGLGADFPGGAVEMPGAVVSEIGGGFGLTLATQYGGAANGVLVLWRTPVIGPWTDDEQALAVSAAEHLGIAIEQIAQHEKLQQLSRTDGMTGLLNRRSFVADLVRRHGRVARGGASGALVYCDLDNFKQVNDTHGHERGDEAICEVARLLERSTRGSDLVARLGGDEFALWLESIDAEGAALKAEELLACGDVLTPYSGGPDIPLGMSLGIAVLDSGSPEGLEALMARADKAMYASKKKGKGGFTMAPNPNHRSSAGGAAHDVVYQEGAPCRGCGSASQPPGIPETGAAPRRGRTPAPRRAHRFAAGNSLLPGRESVGPRAAGNRSQ
jgi:diguanylate cyclase (GGDEF)-like protein/PAS domain S-box-containing protein